MPDPTNRTARNAIVAPQPLAVEEGARVLMAGGNAIDAAVTCAFVQAIVDPQMCGIGGYACLNLHLASAEGGAGGARKVGLDAPALAGSQVAPDMWVNEIIGPNPDGWGYFLKGRLNDAGYTSICTPGWVRAMATMLERWGTISWADALAPAARVAEEGFVVGERMGTRWLMQARFPEACELIDYIRLNPEASRIYLKADGSPYRVGERLRNPDYARTLRHLGERGPDDFYQGELARTMMADLAANGAYVTAGDLAGYRLREDQLVTGSYRGYTVTSATAPHGGPTLIAILNILEGYDLAALGHNSPEYIYLVSMAMKAAFADRNRFMADPAFIDVPLDWMMSEARAAEWRAHIDAGKPIEQAAFTPTGTPDTTHVSVVDRHGNCVALTHSLGASSGVITPGLGFMYNNSMINFDPLPGNANSIAPGKGRTTGMAPAIVYANGRPVLVLGSPGATRIITSNVQVILNVLDFGMSVTDAVHAPRFDCQVNTIRCHARIPEYICAEVRKKHSIERFPQSHGGFALVHAITIDPATGALAGAADTGADGMALVV
ncbi:MAG: gamma-glutamyltransferase family protein [Caldilineaceae bacterium]|nr:gamma-glutamyltransferase family protein [Caldilineaceae bacterium]